MQRVMPYARRNLVLISIGLEDGDKTFKETMIQLVVKLRLFSGKKGHFSAGKATFTHFPVSRT